MEVEMVLSVSSGKADSKEQEGNRQRDRRMEPTLSCHRAALLLTAVLQ